MRPGECLLNLKEADKRSGVDVNLFLFRGRQKADDDEAFDEASAAVAKEDFAAAMSAMAKLRPAVDAFFDKVKVNDDDPKVRENRLKLLNEIRAATRAVADFSRIEG